MQTIKIEIETRKGEKRLTQWGVWQERPYPDITSHGGRLRWQNGGGAFGECGNPARGLENKYGAVLLRDGWTEETAKDNREDYAGFIPYQKTEAIPGAITYRGRNLGETQAEIDLRGTWQGVSFRVRGFDRATGAEAAFLAEQIKPALLAFVEANRAELKAEAVEALRAGMAERLRDAESSLDALESEAEEAIKQLLKG